MTQTSNRIFDEMARLMNDAAGVAQGVRREFDTLFRTQAERILRDLDVVQREEFEAVKEMARLAREENEALKARIAALEAKAKSAAKKSAGRLRLSQVCCAAPKRRMCFLALSGPRRYNPRRSRPPAPLEACCVTRRPKMPPFPLVRTRIQMATVKEMKATARPKGGKGAARAARRSGRVPGVIYGDNKPPLMVTARA